VNRLFFLLICLVFCFSSVGWAFYLKAQSVWPAFGLKKVLTYKDPKKGQKVALVAGGSGIFVLDVSDPYHPTQKALESSLPQPTQIQDFYLDTSGKKPLLWVADGGGGVCSFAVSGKGLSKPTCKSLGGFIYSVWPVKDFLLLANGQGVQLWQVASKEWTLISSVVTPGQARDLAFRLLDPSRLEPEPPEIEGEISGKVRYRIGLAFVADEWGGLRVIELAKVVTYEPEEVAEGEPPKSKVVEEAFELKEVSAWEGGAVSSLSLSGELLATTLKDGRVEIFRAISPPSHLARLGKEDYPGLGEVREPFLHPFKEKEYFLFVSSGRAGVQVFRLREEPAFSVEPVAQTVIAGYVESIFVDEDFNFYAADRQAGLLIGSFPGFISLRLVSNAGNCSLAPEATLQVSDPGPLSGKPVFFCVWLDIPTCGETRGLGPCLDHGFKEEDLTYIQQSFVLVSPEEMTYEWVEGRHCFPVPSFEKIEEMQVLRPDQGFSCEELSGACLNFCLDIDADLLPELCTTVNF